MSATSTLRAPDIVPFSDEHLDGAAVLLAERHRAQRLVERRPRSAVRGSGRWHARRSSALVRCGRRVGRRRRSRGRPRSQASSLGTPARRRAGGRTCGSSRPATPSAGPSSCATSTPLAAARWVDDGRTAPLRDACRRPTPALVDAWFRLGFGHQHVHAIREASAAPGDGPPGPGCRRASPVATTSTRSPGSTSRCPSTRRSRRSSRSAPVADPRGDPSRVGRRTSTTRASRPSSSSVDGEVIGVRDRLLDRGLVDHTGLALPPGAGFLGFAVGAAGGSRAPARAALLGEAVLDWSRETGRDVGRHRLADDEPALVARLAVARVPADLLPPPPRDRLTAAGPGRARAARPPRILLCACHCTPARACRSSRSRTTRCCSAPPPPLDAARRHPRRRHRGVPLPACRPPARVARAAWRPRDGRRPAAGAAAPDRPGRSAAGRARRGARRAVPRGGRPRERDRPRRRRARATARAAGAGVAATARPATGLPWRDRRARLRGGRSAARRRRRTPDAGPPRTRRDRSDRDGRGRRERAPRRRNGAGRRKRARHDARRAHGVPARGERGRRPPHRRRARGGARPRGPGHRALARARPPPDHRPLSRLSMAPGGDRGGRPLPVPATAQRVARRAAAPRAHRRAPGARRRRGAGRAALGRPRGGARARDRRAERRRRTTVRHDRRTAAVGRLAPAARAAEPDQRRRARARSCAAPLAQSAAPRPGRNRRPAAPVLTRHGARAAGAVPRALRGAPRRRRREGARPRGGPGRTRPARGRGLSQRRCPASAASVRGLGDLQRDARARGPRHRRRLPRRGRCASARPRPVAQHGHRARDGRRPRRPRGPHRRHPGAALSRADRQRRLRPGQPPPRACTGLASLQASPRHELELRRRRRRLRDLPRRRRGSERQESAPADSCSRTGTQSRPR